MPGLVKKIFSPSSYQGRRYSFERAGLPVLFLELVEEGKPEEDSNFCSQFEPAALV